MSDSEGSASRAAETVGAPALPDLVSDLDAYHFLFRKGPAVSLLLRDDGIVLDASESAARAFGRPLDDILGRNALSFVAADDLEHAKGELSQSINDGPSRSVEVKIESADDTPRTLLFSPGHVVFPLSDGHRAVLVTGSDVTAQMETELALRDSEESYRTLFQESLDVIYITTRDGRLIDITPSAEALFGYTREELLERDVHHLYADPQDRLRFQREVEEKGSVRNFEVTLVHKDGTLNTCLLTSALRRDASGAPLGYQGIIRNITRFKREQEARERERAAFKAIATVAVQSSDIAGLSREMLRELVGLLGFDTGELFIRDGGTGGLLPAAVIGSGPDQNESAGAPLAATRIGKDVEQVAGSGEPAFVEAEGTHAHASALRAVTLPVRGSGGSLLAVVRFASEAATTFTHSDRALFETISEMLAAALERQFAREERETLGQQLIQAQKMEAIGTLASGVAHDFNNMLTAIRGFADLAMMGTDPQNRVRSDLESIQRAADRGASLVEQLLLFSRKDPVELEPLDLSKSTLAVTTMLAPLIGEDIAIQTSLLDDPPVVLADEGSIQQVLVNLAVNARDAMPQGGTLTLSTREVALTEGNATQHPDARPGRHVVLSVTDDGVGMDQETVERVFDPFFSTKGRGEGTGLGLSVVYGIVEQHGGWVEVASAEGTGTSFSIYFPATPAPGIARPNLPPSHDDDMPDLPLAH